MKNKIILIIALISNLLIFSQLTTENENCVRSSFDLEPNKKYILSAWVKVDASEQLSDYAEDASINILFVRNTVTNEGISNIFYPTGRIIEGWQRIYGEFTTPDIIVPGDDENPNPFDTSTDSGGVLPDYYAYRIDISLNNLRTNEVYFDDLRILPYNGNMKSFVYDAQTQKLMAELDENNYATFYEYDNEGGLVRVKKETEKGVYTIQESRSGNSIKTD